MGTLFPPQTVASRHINQRIDWICVFPSQASQKSARCSEKDLKHITFKVNAHQDAEAAECILALRSSHWPSLQWSHTIQPMGRKKRCSQVGSFNICFTLNVTWLFLSSGLHQVTWLVRETYCRMHENVFFVVVFLSLFSILLVSLLRGKKNPTQLISHRCVWKWNNTANIHLWKEENIKNSCTLDFL